MHIAQDLIESKSSFVTKKVHCCLDSRAASVSPFRYILLDQMQSWLANLVRKQPDEAMLIGHQAKDMIKSCFFAGKKCDIKRDFHSAFYSQHGNCFSYNTVTPRAECAINSARLSLVY